MAIFVKRFTSVLCYAVALFVINGLGIFTPIDHFIQEQRFSQEHHPVSGKFVVVSIDPKSISEVGQWPWPRRIHAQLIDQLLDYQVNEIAFDVDFAQRSNAVDDAVLASALERAGGFVYLAAFQQIVRGQNGDPELSLSTPNPLFQDISDPVMVNVEPDRDGKVRQFQSYAIVSGERVLSMPMAVTQYDAPMTSAYFPVNYGFNLDSLDVISAIDVIENRVEPERLAGKTILVGATAVELGDIVLTPRYGHIPGVALMALAAESRLPQNQITILGAVPGIAFALIAITVLIALRTAFSTSTVIVIYFAGVLLLEILAYVLHAHFNIITSTTAGDILLLLGVVVNLVRELNSRRDAILRISGQNVRMQAILDRVVEDNFDGVIIIDSKERILSASAPAEEILHARNGLAGRRAHILPGILYKETVQLLQHKVSSGIPVRTSKTHMFSDGIYADKGYKGSPVALEYSITVSRIEKDNPDIRMEQVEQVACLTFRDVTERLNQEKRLTYLANHDTLTGAFSRQRLVEELGKFCNPEKKGARDITLFLIDLDRFKNINDSLGIEIGDQLLKQVVRRLGQLGLYCVTRLGGDRFAAVHPGLLEPQDVAAFAQKILDKVTAPYSIGEHRALIGASLGISDTSNSGYVAEQLITHVDMAHSEAKSMPGNSYFCYLNELSVRVRDRQSIEVALIDAVENGQLFVQYQPQVDLVSRRVIGAEALVRWKHPDLGLVRPDRFISVAEDSGMIIEIGNWVLVQACYDAAQSELSGRIAVNVSAVQFEYGDVFGTISQALEVSGLDPSRLDIEITESVFVAKQEKIVKELNKIRELGVGVALDDFGTGYSSLSYLSKLPLDKIKIDQSFIRNLSEDQHSMAIVQSVLSLSKSMNKKVVAEGIENDTQAAMLQRAGCHFGQGYLFGRPLDYSDLMKLISDQSEQFSVVATKAS